jgi:hypothetical protein
MQRFQKSDRPDIPVRHLHFHRDWKVSAIRDGPACGRGSLLSGLDFLNDLLEFAFVQDPF